MFTNKFKEKRGFMRSHINAIVSFTLNDTTDISYRGISQNVCANGLYFTTHHAIKLHDKIKLKLHASKEFQTPLNLEGEVVRCKFDKKNNHLFHVSIKFSRLNTVIAEYHSLAQLEFTVST